MDFLVSKDGKTLIRMTKIDLTEDPYAATMKKIDVAGRPVRGNPNAKVTIVNYDDFECPVLCSHAQHADDARSCRSMATKSKSSTRTIRCPCIPGRSMPPTMPIALPRRADRAIGSSPTTYMPISAPSVETQKDVQNSFNELDHITLDIGKKNGADAARLQACIKAQSDDCHEGLRGRGRLDWRECYANRLRQR